MDSTPESTRSSCRCDFVNRWLDQHAKYFVRTTYEYVPEQTTFSQYVYGKSTPKYVVPLLPLSHQNEPLPGTSTQRLPSLKPVYERQFYTWKEHK